MKGAMIIVEDEAIIGLELKMIMEHAGYSVTAIVPSAEEAIRTALKERPDFIIMDVLLRGDENGVYAAERINGEFKVPILFITGNRQLVREDSFKNVDNYIIMSKPPVEADIVRNVRILTEK